MCGLRKLIFRNVKRNEISLDYLSLHFSFFYLSNVFGRSVDTVADRPGVHFLLDLRRAQSKISWILFIFLLRPSMRAKEKTVKSKRYLCNSHAHVIMKKSLVRGFGSPGRSADTINLELIPIENESKWNSAAGSEQIDEIKAPRGISHFSSTATHAFQIIIFVRQPGNVPSSDCCVQSGRWMQVKIEFKMQIVVGVVVE